MYKILGDRNLFWKNYVEKLPAIYLSVYLYVCAYIVLLMKCIIIQGGPEVTLGLWNWIKKVEIQNLKKNNLWNFRWQESILEKLCRKITGHILVCLSICLCACAFLCLFVNKMHFQTPVSFLCATFPPCKYFQHFN